MTEIDREVEKVKSDWRMLRSDSGWTRAKAFNPNSRTKKLYETLAKMTKEISKIEKSYMNPKSNQYLQRASKALDVSQSSFEEEANKIRDVLFPKGSVRDKSVNRNIADETLNNIPDESLKKILLREVTLKNASTNRQLEPKPLNFNARSRSMKDVRRSGNNLKFDKRSMNDLRLKSALINEQRTSKEMSTDIERYLEEYISDAEKNFIDKEESKGRSLHSPTGDVAEMLKTLNLESYDIYEIVDCRGDSEGDSPSNNARKIENLRLDNSFRAAGNSNTGGKKVFKEITTQHVSPKRDNDSAREAKGLCFDSSIQTNNKFPLKNNAFLGMGLSALNSNFSTNALSRVLQSEYLKKDVSLKPM
ncbi:uncharacterized protein LOC143177198 [Calliopsis andreniformis]|uniref:uncharacterized protein LOC143177198 n=1 Tax=Calliopsis andreniformis TaxID=337506 RepID=UPI003FCCCF72